MRLRLFILLLAVMAISYGCKKNCKVDCTAGISPAAVGYFFNDLDTLNITVYQAGNNFVTPIHSQKFLSKQKNLLPVWHASSSFDSSQDTLLLNGPIFNDWLNYTSDDYDFMITVTSFNKTYKFTELTFADNFIENQVCRGGDAVPGYCTRYLLSYKVNGTLVTFAPDANPGIVYFHK